MRGAGPTICLLALVIACQTPGSSGAPSVRATPEARPQAMTAAQVTATRDSLVAQEIANQVGPGASIRAEFANLSGMRRVVASFHLNADAYVLVGHIDADGVLRIVFPLEPTDDGLVRGNRDYRTPEFFAGFSDQYTARARQSFSYSSNVVDSYDGRSGYAFIIASWRPMRFDQIQTGGGWDTFELADEKYVNDPRPAIYELAAQLAGQNHEAYTVEFARYTSSMPLNGGFAAASSFGLGGLSYCSGYGSYGYGYSLPITAFVPASAFTMNGYAGSFYSRGQYFYYDQLRDCYQSGYQGFYGNPYGYRAYGRIAVTGPPAVPVPTRGFTPRDRSPVTANGGGGRALPGSRLSATDGAGGETPLPSPQYRQRGLITPDDPTTLPGRRTPATDPRSGVDTHTRPTIQEMVGRRPQNSGDGTDGRSRTQATAGSNDHRNFTTAPRRADPSPSEPRGNQGAQIEQRRVQPAPRPPQVEQHRSPPPQTETRVAPVAREAPSRPPPPSPPPSSGSSSSSSGSSTGTRPPTPPSLR